MESELRVMVARDLEEERKKKTAYSVVGFSLKCWKCFKTRQMWYLFATEDIFSATNCSLQNGYLYVM